MAANYVLLERVTVGAAGAASVTFNSIPQTGYTDLKIVSSIRTSTDDNISISFNGVTANYSYNKLYGSGSVTASESNAGGRTRDVFLSTGGSQTANAFANSEVYIPNYTSSNYKSYVSDTAQENNGTTAYSGIIGGLWSQTNAVTSVTFTSASGYNFSQYSTFALYGLAAIGTTPAIAPYAAGGDIIQTDGTYWYHAFLSSGSFVPAKALSCDVLVIAGGGGGGGAAYGGGGGAGGYKYHSSQTITPTTYTVTIGSGGTGSNGTPNGATSGLNSQFGALTAADGGGAGGSFASGKVNGATGGSGGGGVGGGSVGPGTGGAGISGQGNSGGTGLASPPYTGGGGGGINAAGANGSGTGNGGAGTSTYSSWGSATSTGQNSGGTYYYGGGGGGGGNTAGSGGLGGGGNGGITASTAATAGTANTGGGGGGSDYALTGIGGNGGSGIVIVRYAV